MSARWRRSAALVTIILVLVALVVFIALSTKIYTCDLVGDQPHSNLSAIENVHSFDFTSLANFAGYMKYELQSSASGADDGDEKRILTLSYLPLEVDFISIFETQQGSYLFTMNTDCAEFEFNLETHDKIVRVVKITVSLTKENLGMRECIIEAPPIQMLEDGYYSCATTKSYRCEPTTNSEIRDEHPGLIVTLVVEKLELEIGGDPSKIRLGQFSKKINQCKV